MVWFFTRGDDIVQVKTRFDKATQAYVLDIQWPNRPAEIEKFLDRTAFAARLANLEAELEEGAWMRRGGPEISKDAWLGPINH